MIYERLKLEHGNDSNAYFDIYAYETSVESPYKKRPLLVLFPGGGYEFVSFREDLPMALQYAAYGYNVISVRYSVSPFTYPTQYFQAFEAIKYMIDNADKYNIDTKKIATVGYSAGGHMAAMVGTGYNDPEILKEFGVKKDFFKIAGMVLAYPVITSGEFAHRGSFDNLLGELKNDKEMLDKVSIEKRVTKDTPKSFIWSTYTDDIVPCENSLMMANALKESGVPFELHVFSEGGHGLSFSDERTKDANGGGMNKTCTAWMELCHTWLRNNLPL